MKKCNKYWFVAIKERCSKRNTESWLTFVQAQGLDTKWTPDELYFE